MEENFVNSKNKIIPHEKLNLMNAKDHFHLQKALYFVLSWFRNFHDFETNNCKKIKGSLCQLMDI